MEKHVLISYKWSPDRPDSRWLFWLEKKLELQGFQVTMSRLETPPKDTTSWVRDIQSIYSVEEQNILKLEHDPGCLTILAYLEYLAARDIQETKLLIAGTTSLNTSPVKSHSHSYIRLEGGKELAMFDEKRGGLDTFDAKLVVLYSCEPQGLSSGKSSKLLQN